MRALIYTRQSHDKTGGALGVARQRQECQKLIDSRGWSLIHIIEENDTSASIGRRKGFEELLDLMHDGVVDVVVCYHLDRLTRKVTDLERIIEVSERSGCEVATVSGDLNLSTDMGRTIGRILAAVARGEVERKSARQKSANRQKAQSGLPHGARRAFGYLIDGVTICEDEALVLKDIGYRFLNGWSYRELAHYLNDQGVTTAQGCRWFPITIRNMLRRKRYVGVREYEGVEFKATWEPIFDEDTWLRIQYLMRQRSEVAGNKPVAKKYLLTGYLECGACGGSMNGESKRDHPNRPLRKTYQCKHCHGVTRGAIPLDHWIRELIVQRLDTPDLESLLEQYGEDSEVRPLLEKKSSQEARLASLVDDYTDGTLTKSEFSRAKQRAQTSLDATERSLAALHQSSAITGVLRAGQSVKDAWIGQSNGWRRQLIEMLIEKIVVRPGITKPFYMIDGKTYRFDPALIEIAWRL